MDIRLIRTDTGAVIFEQNDMVYMRGSQTLLAFFPAGTYTIKLQVRDAGTPAVSGVTAQGSVSCSNTYLGALVCKK